MSNSAENELLRFVEANGPLTAREVFDGWGGQKGYVRGTVLKMLDRLLRKGVLERELVDHAYRYRIPDALGSVDSHLVHQFVESRLRGDLAPLFTFLAEDESVKAEDRTMLEGILRRIRRTPDPD